MAKETTAPHLHLVQPQRPATPAERAKAYRERQKAKVRASASLGVPEGDRARIDVPQTVGVTVSTPVVPAVSFNEAAEPAPARPLAPIMLTVAALALGAVGVTMNGWFARSLGSSEAAGWLFLAIGVAADLVALAVPACSASAWQARQRGAALAGWAVWLMTFAFALTAGIGFASVNITDVTTSRGERVTPAVVTARDGLRDAMASRDRECIGGVGKVCRAREEAVTERRAALDAAMKTVERTADPQIEAASKIVAWVSGGLVRPSGDDFGMLRLILLALLPQLGGILLMVSRGASRARNVTNVTM
jgi:hypothetical protein